MSADSPAAILFNTDGYQVSVKNNTAIVANTSAIIAAGKDGTTSRFIAVNSDGYQYVSGNISATLSSTSGLALDATLTGGSQRNRLTDGTNNVAVVNAAPTTEYGLVVRNIPSGTQTVSGTITANIGTTNGLALDATLTGGSQRARLTDGTNNAAIVNTAPTTEYGIVVRNVPSGTQTVSGTVTSNIGTTNGLALDATLTGGTQQSRITNGTNSVSVLNAAPTTEYGLVVRNIPSGTQTISGSVTASGTVTANIGTTNGLALDATLTGGGQLARITNGTNNVSVLNVAPVSEYGLVVRNIPSGTQTVSGTVTSNIGTTNGLALDATLTGGSQRNRLTDGTNNAAIVNAAPTTEYGLVVRNIPSGTQTISGSVTASGTVTANIGTTNGLALDATLTGGTQQSRITDGTNIAAILNANPTTQYGVVVRNIPSGTQTVSGTVTANIGTTNGLALDATLTGGTQQSRITDGTNNAAVLNAAPTTEYGVVVRNIPSGTQTVSGSGNFTVAQATASNLNAAVVGTGTAGSPATGVVTVQGITNGTAIPTSTTKSATGTATSVAAAGTAQTLAALNASRLGISIYNESQQNLYVKLGSAATVSSYTVRLRGDAYYEVPYGYTGIITGIWDGTPAGSARITEMT